MGEKVELRQRDVKPTTDNANNGDFQTVVKLDKSESERTDNAGKCTRLHESCTTLCIPCLTSHNPLPENANIFQKFRHGFMLPPHGNLASYFQVAVVCLQVWIVLYAWTHKEALPGGNYFSLLVLFICCVIGGYLISFMKLPPLLGMLIMGLLLKNVPVIRYVGDNIDGKWSAALRKVALTVILTRAGLGLDVIKLKKLSWAVLRLAFIPCAAEIITAGVVSRFLLGFPWAWSLMLGCIMGALSPAVTVPSLVSLQDRRYGVAKGIPTMLLAAGGLDNVLCVTGFSVFFGIIFSDSDLIVTIFKGPIGVLVGLLYGFVAGIFLWYIPAKDSSNKVFFRSMILLGAGLVAIFGSSVINLSGAGPIGCLTTATVAAYKWRQRRQPGEPDEVANVMALSWLIVQHFLFGLIGSAVDVSKIQSNVAGLGIATLAIGLAVRSVFSFTVTMGTGFNIKERVFVTLTWLSKATVQAATGGLAIAEVMLSDKPNPEYIMYGTDVLTISVLAIIICAPIGATLMAVLGPRFLAHGDAEDEEVKREENNVSEEPNHYIVSEKAEETADIKPIENSEFKSELSLTLQSRLSKQSLVDNETVLNLVDTDFVTEEQKGIDNPVFEENKPVQNLGAVDRNSGEEKEKDDAGFEENKLASNHVVNGLFSGEHTGIDNPVYEGDDSHTDEGDDSHTDEGDNSHTDEGDDSHTDEEDDSNSEVELKDSSSKENEFTESNINEVNQEDVDPQKTAVNGQDETVPKDMDNELGNKGTNDTHNVERKYVTTIQISPSSFNTSE